MVGEDGFPLIGEEKPINSLQGGMLPFITPGE
jgi:hypothetical protein